MKTSLLNVVLLRAMVVLVLAGGSCQLANPQIDDGGESRPPDEWQEFREANRGPVQFGWIAEFNDPQLERLVNEAVTYNQDLRAAAARLRIVQESTILARAPRLPSLTAGVTGSYSETRFEDANGDLGPFESSKSAGLSLSASWELDLWGRLANTHRAALADYDAQVADFRGARLSLAANTARAWYDLIAAEKQYELAQKTVSIFKRNFGITERNYKAGDPTASSLDVNFGSNQVASAERALISRRLARDEATRTLELLLGRYPMTEIQAATELPLLEGHVPVGLPSELLLRRPDVVAATADLIASAERASAAKKNLLPSINLTANGSRGIASLELLDLIKDPANVAWNVAASLTQPLYRGGALRAQARQALIQNEAQVASYVATALRAFREVESALAAEHSLMAQAVFLSQELKQADLGEAQSLRDYSQGIVGILSLLEGQSRAFNARSAEISLRNQRIQNRISLHLALGGDFDASSDGSETANGTKTALLPGASRQSLVYFSRREAGDSVSDRD